MQNRETELLKGNPLIDSTYSLSKRWYEDTVFRNQAKKMEEKKNFINDYVRSDFHRKFMNRYVMRWSCKSPFLHISAIYNIAQNIDLITLQSTPLGCAQSLFLLPRRRKGLSGSAMSFHDSRFRVTPH